MTKREIYAKYGIELTKDGKIVSPVGNICELLKEGSGNRQEKRINDKERRKQKNVYR